MAHRLLNPLSLDWRVSTLLVATLCLAPLALLHDLEISNSPSDYQPPFSAASEFYRQASNIFQDYNFLNIAFKGDDLLADEFLDRFETVCYDIEKSPLAADVISLFTFPDLSATGDSLTFEGLLNRENRLAMTVAQRRDRVLKNPEAAGLLVSADATVLAMAIRPTEGTTTTQKIELYQSALSTIKAYGLDEFLAAVSGQVASEVENHRHTLKDLKFFLLTTIILGSILVVVAFGRLFALIPLLLTISASVGTSVLAVKLMEQPFTLISTVLPPMIASLAIALNLHFFNILRLVKQQGLDHALSILKTLDIVHRPALLTAVTTSAGLLSLLASDIPPLRTIGLAGPPGILIQYLLVFHLLPSILLRWDRGDWQRETRLNRVLERTIPVFGNLAMQYSRRILAISGILIMIGLPHAFRLQTETDFLRFYPQDSPLVESTNFFKEHLVGPALLEIHVIGRESESMTIPDNIRTIDQIASWARARPEIDRAASLADIVTAFHSAVTRQEAAEPEIPGTRELISQYLLLYPSDDLYEYVDRSLSRSRIVLNLGIQGSSAVRDLLEDFRKFVSDLDREDVSIRVGGAMHQLVEFERELARGQRNSLLVATAAIVLILLFTLGQPLVDVAPGSSSRPTGFRKASRPESEAWPEEFGTPNELDESPAGAQKAAHCLKNTIPYRFLARWPESLSDTALCAFANASPILMIFIVMGVGGIHLDMGTMMVASVATGIAVDDTIHFFHHYKAQRQSGSPPAAALDAAYQRAGRAITLTTLVLVIQFSILGISDFAPSRNFGLLVAMGLFAAWLFDMLVLPAAILERDNSDRTGS